MSACKREPAWLRALDAWGVSPEVVKGEPRMVMTRMPQCGCRVYHPEGETVKECPAHHAGAR